MSLWDELKEHVRRDVAPGRSYSQAVRFAARHRGDPEVLEIRADGAAPISGTAFPLQSFTLGEVTSKKGFEIPASAGSVELVSINRCLERTWEPDKLLAEVRRVLARNGAVVGFANQWQPTAPECLTHATPVGVLNLLKSGGFEEAEFHPGSDVAMAFWSALGSELEGEAPDIFGALEKRMADLGRSGRAINVRKLQFSANFTFTALRAA